MMLSAQPSRKVLTEDKRKIEESILYLLNKRARLTQFQIGKALYFADLAHLRRYGRPITFDNYAAMEKGPVPSLAYDILKPHAEYERLMGSSRPFTFAPRDSNPEANEFTALRQAREEYLSQSDKIALDEGLRIVLNSHPDEMYALTHDNDAYREAWESRGTKRSKMMLLRLMLDDRSEERAEDLAYMSRG